MLNILRDGPFRYLHSAGTGELILTLSEARSDNGRPTGRFYEAEAENQPVQRTLREWKKIARRRMGDALITDRDGRD